MSKLMKTVAVTVILCFLYSNVVWAGGISSQTLSQDAGRILTEILAGRNPQQLEEGFRRFLERGQIDKSQILSEIAKAIPPNIGNTDLLILYKEILFGIFSEELKAYPRIIKDDIEIKGVTDPGKIIFTRTDKTFDYHFSYADNKLYIAEYRKGKDGGEAGSSRIGPTVLMLLITLVNSLFGLDLKAQTPKPATPTSIAVPGTPTSVAVPATPTLIVGANDTSPRASFLTPEQFKEILEKFNKWLKRISKTTTGLPPSHIGDPRQGFETGAYTYDLAQVAMRYVRTGNFQEARKIILYFAERFNKYSVENLKGGVDRNNVYGILRVLPSPSDNKDRKHIINCINTNSASYWPEGEGIIEWYTDGGHLSWLGMVAVQLLMDDTGLSQEERIELGRFVRELADTIMGLFNPENIVSAGPLRQDIDGAPARENLGSIKNMWDHYAFLMRLADYFETQRYYSPDLIKSYREKAKSILQGLKAKGALVKEGNTAYFWQGFVDGKINGQIPTDVQSWGILSVGPEKLNEIFGAGTAAGTAEGMLNWLIQHAFVLTDYVRPDGYQVTTVGAGFSDPYRPDMTRQRGGVNPQITDEWTAGVINAMDVMANYYYETGSERNKQKAEEILAMADALRFFALARATEVDGMLYWEYSTVYNMPTGFGWNTPSAPGGSLSGNWMLFALAGINPFDPSGKSLTSLAKIRRLGVEEGIRRLLASMGKNNKFSTNPVIKPGVKPRKVEISRIPSFNREKEQKSEEVPAKTPEKPIAVEIPPATSTEIIYSGKWPKEKENQNGVVYFNLINKGTWKLTERAYLKVTVEGIGEYVLLLVEPGQPDGIPSIYSSVLDMGKTNGIHVGALYGDTPDKLRMNLQETPEVLLKQVGISVNADRWGSVISKGGEATSIKIELIKIKVIEDGKGGKKYKHTQLIMPDDNKTRIADGNRRDNTASKMAKYAGAADRYSKLDRFRTRRDSGPRTKAWAGNELDNADVVGREVLKRYEEWLRDMSYKIPKGNFNFDFEIGGVNYNVIHSTEQSYFAVKITKDGITTEKKVFAMPLNDGMVLIPYKLELFLLDKGNVKRQLSSHEDFERMSSGEERITAINQAYSRFGKQIIDEEDFIGLWRKMGIELLLSEDRGKITGIKPLTEEAGLLVGHIGGEIMELVDEYLENNKDDRYTRFSDVYLSSLDATLLEIRLSEVLQLDIPLDVDDFVTELVSPRNTQQIVLGMVSDGKIDLELVERALVAVQSVSEDVSTPDTDLMTTKATLVLANEWTWQNRRMGELKDILGEDLLHKLREGLKSNGYEGNIGDIQDLLISIRKELGRIVQLEKGRIKLSSPYLHAVLANVAGMAGILPQVLLEAYYSDLIEGEAKTTNAMKPRLVNAAVSNALVEIGIVNKRGLINYESNVNPTLMDKVRQLAVMIYGKGINNSTDLINLADLAIGVDRNKDPFGIIEDILAGSSFTGQLSCAKDGTSGVIPLIELLNLDRAVSRTAYSVPGDLKTERQLNTLVITMDQLFTIEKVDSQSGTLIIQPKALGITGKIRQILNTGGNVKIVGNPKTLEMIPEDIIRKAVEQYLGLKTDQFVGELSIEVSELGKVIESLKDPQNSIVIATEEAEGLSSNRGAFVYIPQGGELLGDVITVVTSISLQEGKFTEESKQIMLDYLEKQIFGIAGTEMWPKIKEAIGDFNINSSLFFSLPGVVKFTKRLEELQNYRITVLIAA